MARERGGETTLVADEAGCQPVGSGGITLLRNFYAAMISSTPRYAGRPGSARRPSAQKTHLASAKGTSRRRGREAVDRRAFDPNPKVVEPVRLSGEARAFRQTHPGFAGARPLAAWEYSPSLDSTPLLQCLH